MTSRSLVLGDDAGSSIMMFNTSYSYAVLDALDSVTGLKPLDVAFDHMFAYTMTIMENDVWMHDNEGLPKRFFDKLGKEWRRILAADDKTLKIDGEFTRPAVLAMLQDFKKEVEDLKTEDGGAVKFKFQ